MGKIDHIDQKIIDLLVVEGDLSCAEIATRIGGISERSVRYRRDRLIQQGIIQIKAIVNPEALGYMVMADVLLTTQAGQDLPVANLLTTFDCIRYVACTIGDNDLRAQIVAHSNAELYNFVIEVLNKVPGVIRTTTVIVPLIFKDSFDWRVPAGDIAAESGSLSIPAEAVRK